ncbi:rod shape-determining protein MreD [Alicyclobacillus mali]|uniref:Rod shape-determining protein MreD n=1 Tax=Alicyclobacillus mali (ex Roth et al. 2021) TaxID=1123961 RepID=A0ABS0F620_9BACL|nr:rod shape-determining protein MreD [Alicyclobacillus mali (ex Roth et al. 2021)]MBF8378747.1 rod shape-determining protein MreD [Alicyclobacillus mali (ex Roth et al. 2021)]MCL6488212.1 rod shape-determining protein MreD [Alicyclobacillus mali (ex Roth et al. 2021)]
MKAAIAFASLWVGLILQATLFEIPPMNAIHPDFVLVILVLLALFRGPNLAMIFGIAIGLIQDVCYGPFIGLNAFAYGLAAYIAAAVFSQFMQKNLAIAFLTTMGLSFVHSWLTYGFMRLFELTSDSIQFALSASLQGMIVNGVLALALYPLYRSWFNRPRRRRYDSLHSADSP